MSEHTSNYSLVMKETEAMFEEIKSSPTDTLITSYSGHIFDIIDKEGNVIGKGRVDIEDVSGSWNSATAGWSKRCSFGAVVFDNKMWVMGGYDGSYYNDVWSSSDGTSWNSATAGWSKRCSFGVVVFDNKMWVMGGYDGSDHLNDVWYSSDGASWIKVLDNDPSDTDRWSPRANFGVVVFDNKMWVLGGYDGSYLNDVWCSCDGKNWSQVTTPFPFSARSNHASLVFDNKMWVMGGYDGSNYLDDVWYSSDGTNWNSATAGWPARSSFGVVVFDNKMWVMGGYDGSYLNDVWYSSGYRRLFKIKITCSWQEREGRVIGEDKNLNGQLDTGEDTNGNGELDSPLQIVSYIANKEFPQRIFMIEK